jgi:hypothetical protein
MLFNVVIHFPRVVFLSLLSITTFRFRYIVRAFLKWKRRYFRNEFIRFGGHILFRQWLKRFKEDNFLQLLQKAKMQIAASKDRLQSLKQHR